MNVMTIDVEVTDEQIENAILGNGSLSYGWWSGVRIKRDDSGAIKAIVVHHADPELPESAPHISTTISASTYVAAAAATIRAGSCCSKDMIQDLGYACAEDGDLILQRAVFDGRTIFG